MSCTCQVATYVAWQPASQPATHPRAVMTPLAGLATRARRATEVAASRPATAPRLRDRREACAPDSRGDPWLTVAERRQVCDRNTFPLVHTSIYSPSGSSRVWSLGAPSALHCPTAARARCPTTSVILRENVLCVWLFPVFSAAGLALRSVCAALVDRARGDRQAVACRGRLSRAQLDY